MIRKENESMTENEAIIRCEKLINGLSVPYATSDAFEDESKGYMTFETMRKFAETCKDALEEIQAYRAIGTIEELQALKEKNEPKKPNEISWGATKCPICGYEFGFGSHFKHCSKCGQKIDWQ